MGNDFVESTTQPDGQRTTPDGSSCGTEQNWALLCRMCEAERTTKTFEAELHYMLVQELGSDDSLHELSVQKRHNMLKNRFVVLKAFRGALQMPG
jgi:hypothetical protein